MEDKEKKSTNKVIQPGGLNTDSSPVVQPAGTARFVLNGVNETREGQLGFISREPSNEICYTLPEGYTPVGQVYVGNQEKVVMLASNTGNSIIGLVDRECTLRVLVDDSLQAEKLNFDVKNQIDATYRLRRGCERTIYWVDPTPRYFVIEKQEEFKTEDGTKWDIDKFNLFRRSKKIPVFELVRVLNTGGTLAPGTYNFGIRYLDENLNPSNFLEVTNTVVIYNDSLEKTYREIQGSSSLESPYFTPANTNKSIRINLSNLDTSFPFYQLAIIEASTGTGAVNEVKLTAEIATTNKSYTFTGDNTEGTISEAEMSSFIDVVNKAKNILQVENRLLLSNIEGSPINLCSLQKYASRITADCVLKTVPLNRLSDANGKNPEVNLNGLGYMPGEIYSFCITYVFENGEISPAYHIPGRSPSLADVDTFQGSTENKTYYPMKKQNNNASTTYIDNNTCGSGGYWGVDSEGISLVDKPVRHHRFPLRGELGIPLYTEETLATNIIDQFAIRISVKGAINLCPEGDPDCTDAAEISYNLEYEVAGERVDVINTITVDSWDPVAAVGQTSYLGPILDTPPVIVPATALTEVKEDGTTTTVPLTVTATSPYKTYGGTSPVTGLAYTITEEPYTNTSKEKQYFSQVLGIEFSNIVLPSLEDTAGVKIVGYYIGRQRRTEENKTILDSAVFLPTLNNKSFISHGLLLPEFVDDNNARVNKSFFAMINPEFKFNNRLYSAVDEIIQEGTYLKMSSTKSRFIAQNVMDGTSYDSKKHKKSESDSDGWSLQVRTRDNSVTFIPENKILHSTSDIKEIFYLDALAYKTSETPQEVTRDVFNISGDNKIGILSLEQEVSSMDLSTFPYTVLKRNLSDPYANFRTDPFYKETQRPIYFSGDTPSVATVFNGDSYIGSMKYISTAFYENRIRKRRGKSGILNTILGAVIVAVGVVLAVFTAGASLAIVGLGAAMIGAGGLLAASGIRQENWKNTYSKLYAEGLRETVEDEFLKSWFKDINPGDDEIRWVADAITNLWFESAVNINLRQGANKATSVDFIGAPTEVQTGNGYDRGTVATTVLDNYILNKLTTPNVERAKGNNEGREYIGLPLPELYDINPDLMRRSAQKYFTSLGIEYDCCSDCFEKFPGRTMYSEQAFQEELTDNFRSFLPNNYRDIEGETGQIMDMFRIQSNLYLHTEEALWHLPQNYQERVIGNLLTVVGTGDYFNTPPRKIVDDEQSSAGTLHKWGRIKSKYGILFPSHREKKIYLFNGETLEPISSKGMFSHFREFMNFSLEQIYYNSNKKNFPFLDSPVNPLGVGYVTSFDPVAERFLITKKDIVMNNLPTSDYELCAIGSESIIFPDLSTTIAAKQDLGFQFVGIENCRLKFQKETFEERTEIRYKEVSIFKDVDYLVFIYGMPAGFTDLDTVSQMMFPFLSTKLGYGLNGVNTDYFSWAGDQREEGKESVLINIKNIKRDFPNNNEVLFSCMAYWHKAGNLETRPGGEVTMVAKAYKGGTMVIESFVFTNIGGIQQGDDYSFPSVFVEGPETDDSTLAQPMGDFTYTISTGDLSRGGVSGGDLPPSTAMTPVEVQVLVPVTIIEYVEGVKFTPTYVNSSGTLSYSLKTGQWVSWHSYLPSMYLNTEENFFSWQQGSRHIYRHNVKGSYGKFYGQDKPFIVEVVESSNPLITESTEGVLFQTEAVSYSPATETFVDEPDITFNEVLLYNSYQLSDWLSLLPKANTVDYLQKQVAEQGRKVTYLERSERDWSFNDFRDYSSLAKVPMFIKSVADLQTDYFIDKIVNPLAVDAEKHWYNLEVFRDKYLVMRLKFLGNHQIKLTFNFLFFDKKTSER
jgi:hypothetical protein